MRDTSIVVLVPKYGIEGVIDIVPGQDRNKDVNNGSLNEDSNEYSFDQQKMALVHGKDPSKTLSIFDEIIIKISVIDNGFCQRLKLELVGHDKNLEKKAGRYARSAKEQRKRVKGMLPILNIAEQYILT